MACFYFNRNDLLEGCLGLDKKLPWFFSKMLWKNPNELLGQPNKIDCGRDRDSTRAVPFSG